MALSMLSANKAEGSMSSGAGTAFPADRVMAKQRAAKEKRSRFIVI
jgi:hypothetical protein